MNNTPNLPANNGSNGQNSTSKNGSTYGIKPGEAVSLSDVIKNVKKAEQTPGDAKQPTTYPAPKVEPAATAPEAPAPKETKAEPAQEAPAPQAEPEQPTASPQPEAVKRSRSEEITFQIEKAQKLQSINNQLVSMRGKLADLKQFSYRVDEDDNHSYGRLAIYDDANHEFSCKHHGLAEMVVEFLMSKFETKIEEKENELLAVSAW